MSSFDGGDEVATDTDSGALISIIPGDIDLSGEFDPVRITAADRPYNDTLPVMPDPAADHECTELERRREDIEREA